MWKIKMYRKMSEHQNTATSRNTPQDSHDVILLRNFRGTEGNDTNTINSEDIPVKPKNRTVTDKNFARIYLSALITTLFLMAYTYMSISDLLIVSLDHWGLIIGFSLFAIFLSMVLLLLLLNFPSTFIWSTVVLTYCFEVVFWINIIPVLDSNNVALPIIYTIVMLIVALLMTLSLRRLELVIILCREAATTMFALPGLLTIPIYCALSVVLVNLVLANSAFILALSTDSFAITLFVFISYAFMWIWTLSLIYGFQCMLIAGSIANWYFTRDKQNVHNATRTSLSNIFRFHFGSICLGSFILEFIFLFKQLVITPLSKVSRRIKILLEFFTGDFLKYHSKNAYIETAIRGEPFYKSGKRAVKLMASNAKDIVLVNYFTNVVITILVIYTIILLLFILMMFSILTHYDIEITDVVLAGSFIVLIPTFIFSFLWSCIDILYICFCEDREVNDGLERPYYMSRSFMEFVEKSKKASQQL